jgi:3-hydroxyacyl-CoA dehydrogenase / 3-hydroxy-2-methylbutyryl-CoA dehydrogenase
MIDQEQTPMFVPADVTNEQQIQDMFDQVKKTYGRLDSVVNCAGIGVAFRTYNINRVSRINRTTSLILGEPIDTVRIYLLELFY